MFGFDSAHWIAAGMAIVLALATTVPLHAQTTDLLISEYVEGSGSDKALEIFNGTGAQIDLSDYQLELYSNGSTSGTAIPLTGMLSDSDIYVIANSSASFSSESYVDDATGAISHNGDDAYILRHIGSNAVVDSFGRVGEDPGEEWPAPSGGTRDNTLRRLSTVCSGDTDQFDTFDGNSEWEGLGNNVFDGLGSHSADCLIDELFADRFEAP